MVKQDFVKKISVETGIEKKDILVIIDKLLKEIRISLESGETIYLRGFGTFYLKNKAEKKGRHFVNNVEVLIPAHQVPAFKPSKKMLEKIKNKSQSKSNKN